MSHGRSPAFVTAKLIWRSAAALMCVPAASAEVPRWTIQVADEVRQSSYPELSRVAIRFRGFQSRSDFFQTRFGFTEILRPGRMRYTVYVNESAVLSTAPRDGVAAILAHEFEHILYYRSRNRLRMAGLIRLLCVTRQAEWEHTADREAIRRGYGGGLRKYRLWLYDHIPPDAAKRKRRVYLTPEEITGELGKPAGP